MLQNEWLIPGLNGLYEKLYNMDHLQKSWSDPKDSRVPGFKDSSEIP